MLAGTNDAIAREERVEAVEELKTLVEDWKGHRIEGFGDLLLHGQYTVLKGESMSSKNEEREVGIVYVHTYAFTANSFIVQDLPFRDDPPLLQRDQRQQAKEQNVHSNPSHQRRKAQIAAQRPYLHAERHRDNLPTEARYDHRSLRSSNYR